MARELMNSPCCCKISMRNLFVICSLLLSFSLKGQTTPKIVNKMGTNQKSERVMPAIQQFQLRPVIGNEKNARKTLKLVKEAGYEGIELNGFMIRKMPLIVPMITWMAGMPIGTSGRLDWKKLISESGLKVVSVHEDLGTILKNPQKIIEEANSFGTEYIVVTGMFRYDYSNFLSVCELSE